MKTGSDSTAAIFVLPPTHLHIAIPGVDTMVAHEKGAVKLSTKVDFRHKSSLLFRLHGVPHELRVEFRDGSKDRPRRE